MPHFACEWSVGRKNGMVQGNQKWCIRQMGTRYKLENELHRWKSPQQKRDRLQRCFWKPLVLESTKDSNDITWIWLNMKVNWEFHQFECGIPIDCKGTHEIPSRVFKRGW